ncbi:hypothetical protein B0H19DRAFT_1063077 [Mycena capillaripes]|nr:hypothetical protein B0H19DRAFT_1063077 [Mycena capillaripes]
MSVASVEEIPPEDFPALRLTTLPTVTKPRHKKGKKGKGKAVEPAPEPVVHDNDASDVFLAADLALATAASLGIQTAANLTTEGASSSRRPAAAQVCKLRSDMVSPTITRPVLTPLVLTSVVVPSVSTAPTLAPAASAAVVPAAASVAVHVVTQYVELKVQRFYFLSQDHPVQPTAAVPAEPATTAVLAQPPSRPAAQPAVQPAAAAAAAVPVQLAAVAAPAQPTAAAPVQPVAPAVPGLPAGVINLPPMWLTADGHPPCGSYTPTPAGGFPAIVYSAEFLRRGISPQLAQMHVGVPQNVPELMRTHGLIRAAITDYVNIDPTSFTIGTPPTASNGASPAIWLIADIDGPLTQAILDARVISCTDITIFPLPFDMPVNGFVGTFSGFTPPHTNMGANTACDLILTALNRSDGVAHEISQFVQSHRDAYSTPMPVSAAEAWEIFRASHRGQSTTHAKATCIKCMPFVRAISTCRPHAFNALVFRMRRYLPPVSIVVRGIVLVVQDTNTTGCASTSIPRPAATTSGTNSAVFSAGSKSRLHCMATPDFKALSVATSAPASATPPRSARSPMSQVGPARPPATIAAIKEAGRHQGAGVVAPQHSRHRRLWLS